MFNPILNFDPRPENIINLNFLLCYIFIAWVGSFVFYVNVEQEKFFLTDVAFPSLVLTKSGIFRVASFFFFRNKSRLEWVFCTDIDKLNCKYEKMLI